MSTQAVLSDPRPRTATGKGSLLGAELGRLRHRRMVFWLAVAGLLGLLLVSAALFFTHSNDIAGARADAVAQAQEINEDQKRFAQQCMADPNVPQEEKEAMCDPGGGITADEVFEDPRLFADQGLPGMALGVGIAGALIAALVGATGVGAD